MLGRRMSKLVYYIALSIGTSALYAREGPNIVLIGLSYTNIIIYI